MVLRNLNILFIISVLLIISCNNTGKTHNNDIDSSLIKSLIPTLFDFDSLKKYSYLVYADVNTHIKPNGTGFFIRDKGNLYFVSAAHVFEATGGNVLHPTEIKNYPDTMQIIVYRKGNTLGKYKLAIGNIKNRLHSSLPFNNPDVYAFKINEKDIPTHIYSIEKFIDTTYDNHKIAKAVTCGYVAQKTIERMLLKPPACTEEDLAAYYWKPMRLGGLANGVEYDSVNYPIKLTVETEGYSGSPVYLIYENRLIFGGLAVLANPQDKWLMVLRPEYVLKEIRKIEKGSTNK